MKIEIGAYEAKAKLPELLRQVQAGKRFTITKRGKAIADLVPSEAQESKDPALAIDRFLAFKKANPMRARSTSRHRFWAIGILNLLVLVNILKVWRQSKSVIHSHAHLEELLTQRGFINRLLGGRIQKIVNHSWQMYPLGLLFGLGFDTASEIGLLALTAGAASGDLPVAAMLSLPILFAAGMSAMDTTDGVLMKKAYSWAFLNPLRKIFYNLTITTLWIAVALVIGTIELLQVSIGLLHLNGRFFDFIRSLEFGSLGYIIVGVFLIAWGASVALLKCARIEERYGLAAVHVHEHTHDSGLRHSHKHIH
jgi:nickel/cobalt transporter (NiCoT) family protein